MSEVSANTAPARCLSFWRSQLVRCVVHGEGCCWVQIGGANVSPAACTCWPRGERSPALCPIDAHRVPWILDHPDFEED